MTNNEPSEELRKANERLMRMRERYKRGLPIHEEDYRDVYGVPSGFTAGVAFLIVLLVVFSGIAVLVVFILRHIRWEELPPLF